MHINNPELRQRLADDYVIGLMTAETRRNFEKRLHTDPLLREALQKSEALWNNLGLAVPDEIPPKMVWSRVSERLFEESEQNEITFLRNNLGSLSEPQPNKTAGWLIAWSLIATLSLITLLPYTLYQHYLSVGSDAIEVASPHHHSLCVLSSNVKGPGWLVETSEINRSLRIYMLQATPLDSNHTYQLWLLTDSGQLIKSFGFMPETLHYERTLSQYEIELLNDAVYLSVTIEPAGGSPNGTPSTAPIFLGKLLPSDMIHPATDH
ncbi:anti-sigma factor [Thiomicrorhabdus xiamenensis]|uniref:Anti-sigma factor n=1 Tax=Thiomicrorhabdus xiamenensis TaxID=2739063 RepID=A0A7D4T1E4_9GAMM|nr:anti-sigma factor [Thiomicrorhabdus xiamenensis]QKI89485.1 anti-sigma factor [Thiomicrorhabdus xiamenensis]